MIFTIQTTPETEVLSDFSELGEIGIIGEYWNTYMIAATNPDQIKATPYEGSGAVRNLNYAYETLNQKRLFVVRNMWMDNFPDTLIQFNTTLIKKGNEEYFGDCNVCEYSRAANL